MTADLAIQGVTHHFGDVVALNGVDIAIGAGRFAVLLGPSGCGKTTLLSILGGFLTPSRGRVMIGGEDVTDLAPAKRPTTTMFQDYALFPHMSVGDNVAFGLRMRGFRRAARQEKATETLELVGLAEAFSRLPHELSGGQRQRVALARALAVEPDVLLLDEPLGALDVKLRRQMQDELKAIQRRVGTTFVHVTHDQEEAMAVADEIIVMNQGTVQDHGPPGRIYLQPRTAFSAAFMGEVNAIDGQHREAGQVDTAFGLWRLPDNIAGTGDHGSPVKLFFRPEHLMIAAGADGHTDVLDLGNGTIKDIAFFGTHHRCRLRLDRLEGREIIAHLPPAVTVVADEQVRLKLDPSSIVVLPGERS